MVSLLKSSFLWQFAGGFLLGALGLVALHPGDAHAALAAVHAAPVHAAAR